MCYVFILKRYILAKAKCVSWNIGLSFISQCMTMSRSNLTSLVVTLVTIIFVQREHYVNLERYIMVDEHGSICMKMMLCKNYINYKLYKAIRVSTSVWNMSQYVEYEPICFSHERQIRIFRNAIITACMKALNCIITFCCC